MTANPFPLPTRAYDIEMLKASAKRGTSENQGWVYGLPPGITSAQWPLDPNSGYPLMHGFTLLLPEDYRCHGPEIVALSFFATAPEHNDGGPEGNDRISEIFARESNTPPSDPELMPFWQSRLASHPRLQRMDDILGCAYAVILLTQTEFDGPLCKPKPIGATLHVSHSQPPPWMEFGAARSFVNFNMKPNPDWAVEDQVYFKTFGEMPEARLDWHRAISWTPRANDPNAGKAPMDPHITSPVDSGYQQFFYWQDGKTGVENYREHAWVKDLKPLHIGGTMRPVQNTPQFSPFYVEFEEDFGGYNFGSGNGQLDFRDMKFDWAC